MFLYRSFQFLSFFDELGWASELEMLESEVLEDFVNGQLDYDEDNESEWEDGNDDENFNWNAFDFIIDDEHNL